MVVYLGESSCRLGRPYHAGGGADGQVGVGHVVFAGVEGDVMEDAEDVTQQIHVGLWQLGEDAGMKMRK